MFSYGFLDSSFVQNRWGEMFPGMIGKSYTLDVISSGMGGSINGALQLVHIFKLLSCFILIIYLEEYQTQA